MVAGADYVELINIVDKKRLDAPNYYSNDGKESVNFAFSFDVPNGDVRVNVPYGVIRPEQDQLPSACKNWLTVGRWADVSNDACGVTLVTLDAPLLQVGGITATLLNSQTDPTVWRKTIEPTQKFYSWAMNNHWGTNYRAYQEGPVRFRYVLRPHVGRGDDATATRFAIEFSQPLLAAPGRGTPPPAESLVKLDSDDVVVTGVKPSDDGKAIILRLLSVSDHETAVHLTWPQLTPRQLWMTNTGERPRAKLAAGPVRVPARGVVTLRAE